MNGTSVEFELLVTNSAVMGKGSYLTCICNSTNGTHTLQEVLDTMHFWLGRKYLEFILFFLISVVVVELTPRQGDQRRLVCKVVEL